MSKTWKGVAVLGLVAGLVAAYVALPGYAQRREREHTGAGPAHYSVVITEGHNLLVTDNAANKLYFYSKDHDKPIGSPLKLRASLDLTTVGQDEIHINNINLEKPPEQKDGK